MNQTRDEIQFRWGCGEWGWEVYLPTRHSYEPLVLIGPKCGVHGY
jgi:hypothetical protein